jgi:hypothetical protein
LGASCESGGGAHKNVSPSYARHDSSLTSLSISSSEFITASIELGRAPGTEGRLLNYRDAPQPAMTTVNFPVFFSLLSPSEQGY